MKTGALSPASALREAVKRAGSQAAMARMCGVAQPSVWRWLNDGKPLPAEHVLTVERETGVPRQQLRPDLYPDEPPAAAAQSNHGRADDSMVPAR